MNILTQLLEIIFLKRQPQDIDYDEFSAFFYVAMAIGVGYIINTISGAYSRPLQYSLVQNVMQAVALYGILAINKKGNRFIQSCTTLFGVSAILQLVSLTSILIPGLAIFSLFLAGWVFYLTIIILRESLESSTLMAVFVAISIGFVSVAAVIMIYPDFLTEFVAIYEQAQKQQ
ncbi:MAG: hypothetical protein AAF431_18780 [Pseudomonadota bacterium]